MLPDFGKILITVGLAFIVVGALLIFSDRLPFFHIGRLPGDIAYRRGNFSFYFPWVTCLLISLLLTLLFWVFGRK